jgi:hypothetical protein
MPIQQMYQGMEGNMTPSPGGRGGAPVAYRGRGMTQGMGMRGRGGFPGRGRGGRGGLYASADGGTFNYFGYFM